LSLLPNRSKIDYKEIKNKNDFEKQALYDITKSLQCLYLGFVGLQNQDRYSVLSRASHPSWGSNNHLIEIWNYETGKIESPIEITIFADDISGVTFSLSKIVVFLEDIKEILAVRNSNDKIDQYIELFLILESLGSDPVLHLITLSSLYEYVNETSGKHLESLFNERTIGKIGKERVGKRNFRDKQLTFKDKFICTRNLVAHGLVDEYTNVYNLEKIVEIAPLESDSGKKFYSFDRYNPSYINLINEVIGEAQTIIQKYLRQKIRSQEIPLT